VIVVKLRETMEAYRRRTGERITYDLLAERTGLARATLESIASRVDYNASLRTIDKICEALHCTPTELLEFHVTERVEKAPPLS
jgi:DNA-binding Xre family transcriptional regulator